MTARLLDGRLIAAEVWAEVERDARDLHARRGAAPHLVVVRVGDDPASRSYQRQIERAFGAHGLAVSLELLPESSSQQQVAAALERLAADAAVDGILLQLPLPAGLRAAPLIDALPLDRDLEGLHPYHAGRLALGQPTFVPSTPAAGLEILRRAGVPLTGRLAVVLGRSSVIGRPMASLLLGADCTVLTCHSRTPDLGRYVEQADIVVAAAGRPGLITADMLKPGAAVIDFGTTMVDGKLTGDVEFGPALAVAGAITPVPGGTGPVTTAMLGRNLLQAARLRRGEGD